MPAKDFGQKHSCWKCGTKFYDMKKDNPVCPKCGADPRQAPVAKSTSSAAERKASKARDIAASAVEDEVAEDAELPDDDDDAAGGDDEEVAEAADDDA